MLWYVYNPDMTHRQKYPRSNPNAAPREDDQSNTAAFGGLHVSLNIN